MQFDYYILAILNISSTFYLHGLWPQYKNGSWPQYCNDSYKFNYTTLEHISVDIVSNWADGYNLVKHEWNKHGTCALSSGYIYNELDYVSTALWLFMRLDPNGKYDIYKHLPIIELESNARIGFICDDNGVITEGRTLISPDFKYMEKWSGGNC